MLYKPNNIPYKIEYTNKNRVRERKMADLNEKNYLDFVLEEKKEDLIKLKISRERLLLSFRKILSV